MTRRAMPGPLFLVLLLASAVVGVLRFWNLGDLSWTRKYVEGGLWAAVFFIVGSAAFRILVELAAAGRNAASASPLSGATVSALKPEELTSIESELPEVDKPQVDGMRGKPPEELAQVISSLSRSGDA